MFFCAWNTNVLCMLSKGKGAYGNMQGGFASFVAQKHVFDMELQDKCSEIHRKRRSLRANAQKNNVQGTFGSKMAPKWQRRPSKWSHGAPKVNQKAPKGPQREREGSPKEPQGSQKDVKREPRDDQNASKYRCPKIVRKKGALFPVL